MATNTGDIAALLRPGLNAVFGRYPQYPEQWKDIFTIRPSNMAQELDVEMQYLGIASYVAEGVNIPSQPMAQRVMTTYINRKFGNSFTITKEAIRDNLYQSEFPQQVKSMVNSFRQAKNVGGANILNNAFSANFTIGDGNALCSTTHPISTGVYSNKLTSNNGIAIDFSEAGLENAIILIQQFPDQAGLLTMTKPKRLIIPRNLQFAASRIFNSAFMPDNGNNAINPMYHDNYFSEKYSVNQYLINPLAWFITTDAPKGLTLMQRQDLEHNMYPTYDNQTVTAVADERYVFGCSNPRGILGSPGI